MVQEDGLGGVTSNPSIFEEAISGSSVYAQALKEVRAKGALDAKSLYEALAFADIAQAADILGRSMTAPRRDGYVRIEVPPNLAQPLGSVVHEIGATPPPPGWPFFFRTLAQTLSERRPFFFGMGGQTLSERAYFLGKEGIQYILMSAPPH